MPRAVGDRPVLQVRDVRTRFRTPGGGMVHAVNGISFDLHEGELLGVVGESGSGKSVTTLSLLKLLPMPPAEIASGQALSTARTCSRSTRHGFATCAVPRSGSSSRTRWPP